MIRLSDPSGLYTIAAADGSVIVGWQEVPGVQSYQVTGVALPAPVIVNRTTEWRSAKLSPGPRQWNVASVYEPGGVLTAASAWPAAMSHSLPKPGRPFLRLPAGLGTTAEIQDHHPKQCPPEGTVYTNDMHLICARKNASDLLGWSIGGGMYPTAGPGRVWPGAAFADTHDLGVGRRVSCWKSANSESRLCWATNHGEVPGSGAVADGASLLPLVPAHLGFSSPQARANSEEEIRRINQFVLESNPAPAVAAQITTPYNGAPFTPGARANDKAVPPGWAQQPGHYRQGTAPYCGSCHFAQTGSLSFTSFGNSVQQMAAIRRTVCAEFTMPHSELASRRFWTDGGAVSLPGLLSTVLGYASCAQ